MLDFEHNYYNIMDCVYKGVSGQEARGGLYLPIVLFGVDMNPRSANHKLRQA